MPHSVPTRRSSYRFAASPNGCLDDMAEMQPLKPSDRPPTTREYPNDRDAEIAKIEKVDKASGVHVHEMQRSRNIRDRLCDEHCCSEAHTHQFPRHRLRRRQAHSKKGRTEAHKSKIQSLR